MIKPIRPYENGTRFRDRANGQTIETLSPQDTAKGYTAYRYAHNPRLQASLPDDVFDAKFEHLPRANEDVVYHGNATGAAIPPAVASGSRATLYDQLQPTATPQDAAPTLEEERAIVEQQRLDSQSQRGATSDQMEIEAQVRRPRSPTEPGIAIVPPNGANALGGDLTQLARRKATSGERMIEGAREAVEVARHGVNSPEGAASAYNVTRSFSTIFELGEQFENACEALQKVTQGVDIDPREVEIYGAPMAFTLRRGSDGKISMRFMRLKQEDI